MTRYQDLLTHEPGAALDPVEPVASSTQWAKPAAPTSRLSEQDIRAIRAELNVGHSRRKVALKWGVSLSTITKIDRRDTFGWIPDDPDMPARLPINASAAEREQAQREHAAREEAEALALVEHVQQRVAELRGGGK